MTSTTDNIHNTKESSSTSTAIHIEVPMVIVRDYALDPYPRISYLTKAISRVPTEISLFGPEEEADFAVCDSPKSLSDVEGGFPVKEDRKLKRRRPASVTSQPTSISLKGIKSN
ncbi:uncharacterized protein IL334_003694 [Kwoniella shivajii]|uniref:Uncharacterized protein n=1 Tax=Kwoniella shivajii TaxID=564305 RepID=A0ABZ1CY99_9TREE|nr:hypothetical protein IL334_003694 [Kwoniella shivajii]